MKHTLRMLGALVAAMLLPLAVPVAAQDRNLYDEIIADMESIRELEMSDPLDVLVITREEFQEQYAGVFMTDAELEALAVEQLVLVAFGLFDADADLADLYSGAYGEGIAGYYVPGSNQMVVITETDDEQLTAFNVITFAHETVHAIQDQNFNLSRFSGVRTNGSNDESLAVTALIEGDASLAETDYLLNDLNLALAYLTEARELEVGSGVWETAPPILLVPLRFPYSEGQRFVQYLYDEGGWNLVNAAYDRPPTTTEQVLHPGKYLDGEEAIPVEVPNLAEALGAGWRVIEQDTWGEFSISIILGNPELGETELAQATSGWGGDQYVALTNDDDTAIAWDTEWDSVDDAGEFLDAMIIRESGRLDARIERDGDVITLVTDDVVVQIVRDGSRVTYLQGPDALSIEAMSDALVK